MFPKSLVSNLWTLLWSVLYYQLCEDFLYGMLSRCAVIVFSVIVKVLSGGWRCFHLKSITIVNIAGALLSYFLEPIYIFSVTIGQSHIASKTSSIEDEVMRVIHERILPLSNKLMDPFQVNKPLVFVAPIPPEEFQHSETALTTLTCGYSICWDNSGLHEVILGTTGRKQGTSAKGAMSPSTESTLCKKRFLESFLSLSHNCLGEHAFDGNSYRELKDKSHEYNLASETFKSSSNFKNWFQKPQDFEAFSFMAPWRELLMKIDYTTEKWL